MKRREFIGTAAGAAAWSAWSPGTGKIPKPGLPETPDVPKQKPVRLRFEGDLSGLRQGIDLLARELNFEVSPKGMPVRIERRKQNDLIVEKKGNQATIRCSEKIHFFRGLGLLLQEMKEKNNFSIREEPQFQTNGIMFDVTQGSAVINVPNVKILLNVMAVMGLNMIMLYSEDSYRVESDPYIGYMRGKYTQDDLREIDRYADIFGIEAIPCMQTLAHLEDVLKWDVYSDIREDESTLLVGSEKTYQFIERTVRNAAAPFRTKRIHIGMDEAWKLGQGNYLKQHGLRRKIDIMTEHLDRVLEITARNGLQPMIWSDMYFRAASATGDYYDRAVSFSPQDLATDSPRSPVRLLGLLQRRPRFPRRHDPPSQAVRFRPDFRRWHLGLAGIRSPVRQNVRDHQPGVGGVQEKRNPGGIRHDLGRCHHRMQHLRAPARHAALRRARIPAEP